MYVSATVSSLITSSGVPRTDKNIVQDDSDTDIIYQKVVNTNKYYTNTYYKITKGNNGGEVLCYYSYTGAYTDGRFIPATEKYYKGRQMGWYIILDQSGMFDDEYEPEEIPVIIFAGDNAGKTIIVEGEIYKKTVEQY